MSMAIGYAEWKPSERFPPNASGFEELLTALQKQGAPIKQLDAKVTALVTFGLSFLCGLETGELLHIETQPELTVTQFQPAPTDTGAVKCIAVTGDKFVSGCEDNILHVWDLSSHRKLAAMYGHTDRIRCAVATGDGRIISGSEDKTLRLWDLRHFREVEKLQAYTAVVNCVALTGDVCVSGSQDTMLRVWNLKTLCEVAKLQGHSASVECVAIVGEARAVSGSDDYTLRLWSLTNFSQLAVFTGHTNVISGVAVVSDTRFVSVSADRSLRVWDLSSGRELCKLESQGGALLCVGVTADSACLTACEDRTLSLWDLAISKELAKLQRHIGPINCLSLTKDGKCISGSRDKTLSVWDMKNFKELAKLEGHSNWVRCIAVSNSGLCVSASDDKTLRVWDLKEYRQIAKMQGHSNWVRCVTITSDDRCISGSDDSSLRVWDLTSYKQLAVMQGHTKVVRCVTATSDGRCVSGSDDKTLRVWNLSDYLQLAELVGHSNWVKCVNMVGEDRCVSGSDDKTLRVWCLITYRELATLLGHTAAINSVAVTGDGRCISASDDNSLRVWDLVAYEPLAKLEGHTNWVKCVSVAGDDLCVSGSSDKTLRVWSLSNYKEVSVMEGHMSSIYCLAVLDDGRYVSASDDKTLRVWESPSRTCVFSSANDLLSVPIPFLLKASIQPLKDGEYRPKVITKMEFRPFGFNALHITVWDNHAEVLRVYLEKDGVPILRGYYGSPLTIALSRNAAECVDVILDHFVAHVSEQDIFSEVANIAEDIPTLLTFSSLKLHAFFSVLLQPSRQYPRPLCIAPKVTVPCTDYIMSESFFLSRYDKTNKACPSTQRVKFHVSVLAWNFTAGSEDSLRMLTALRNCDYRTVLATAYVQAVIEEKWSRFQPFTIGIAIAYFCTLGCFVGIIFWDSLIPLVAFAALTACFFVYEVVLIVLTGQQYFADFWHCLEFARICLSCAWGLSHEFGWELEWQMCLLVLATCLARGFVHFRAFRGTRIFAFQTAAVLRETYPFLFILAYSTLAFGLLAAVLSSAESSLDVVWTDAVNLALGIVDSSTLSPAEWVVVTSAMVLNVMVLMNLLVPILGAVYARVQSTLVESDLQLQLDVVLEYETMLIFRRDQGRRRHVLTCRPVSNSAKDAQVADTSNTEVEVAALAQQVAAVDGSVNGIKRELAGVESKIVGMEGKLTGIETKVLDMQNKLDALMDLLRTRR